MLMALQQSEDELLPIAIDSLNWYSVDDSVMGGVSAGTSQLTKDELLFLGEVSLENNGGFSSIRTSPLETNLQGHHGLKLLVMGDGKTYQFRIRTDANRDGVNYSHPFETQENEWIEVELPFSDFVPGYRGRIMSDYGLLNPSEIKTLGILISDKQEGPYKLRVKKISAYQKTSSP